MIDFSKKLKQSTITRIVAPIDLYASLDRRSDAGPLRPAQESILNEWFKSRNDDKDIIIKLHTGEGKTLIGLLMLLSNMNAGRGPSLYVCPNIYLAEQVRNEALKFGVPFCEVSEDNSIPNEFTQSKAILITHAYKVFHGLSIFGTGNQYEEVGTILIDDSHACVEIIRESFTMRIDSNTIAYSDLKDLFENDLKQQSSARFYELEFQNNDTIIPISYWSWNEKLDSTIKILSKYTSENYVKFCWPLLRDDFGNCQAYISSKRIEISPLIMPIEKYKVFHKAKQRILMSATTQNDAFFIKGLLLAPDAIKKPITYKEKLWSGEKMILIPSLMADNFDRNYMVTQLAKPTEKSYGVVALTSSFSKAEFYAKQGAIVANDKNGTKISDAIRMLKNGTFTNTIVFVNRYDGIDLPDRSCRILILDSLPYSDSLADRYEEHCRTNSTITLVKTAQKIEQGLGRSVRGEKDFSVIFIIGPDLVKFMKSSKSSRYFSDQTQMQVDIGLEIVNMAGDDSTSATTDQMDIQVINDLVNQCLHRKDSWKQYYTEKMNCIQHNSKNDNSLLETLEIERQAENAYLSRKYRLAVDIIQRLVDSKKFDEPDNGWYLQMMARYIFPLSKFDAQSYQKAAFIKNYELIRPIDEIQYKKIPATNEKQCTQIKRNIMQKGGISDFLLYLSDVLSNFSIGINSDCFEESVDTIGKILGFESQRPDKILKKGPDNLWYVGNGHYVLIECKSEAVTKFISKAVAGQCEEHCGWFESEYPKAQSTNVLICHANKLENAAYFSHPFFTMREHDIFKLSSNLRAFFQEFIGRDIEGIDDSSIFQWLNLHKLTFSDFEATYLSRLEK